MYDVKHGFTKTTELLICMFIAGFVYLSQHLWVQYTIKDVKMTMLEEAELSVWSSTTFSQSWGISRHPGAPNVRCARWWTGLPQKPVPLPLHSSAVTWCILASAVCSVAQTQENTHTSYQQRTTFPTCAVTAAHTCNLRSRCSMGMTLRMGSSVTRILGLLIRRQPFSTSQSAPSRYRPDTKQPTEHNHSSSDDTADTCWHRMVLHHYHMQVCQWFPTLCGAGSPLCTGWTHPKASRSTCMQPVPEPSGRTLVCAVLITTWLLVLLHPPVGHNKHAADGTHKHTFSNPKLRWTFNHIK